MVLYNSSSMAYLVFTNYSSQVFGSPVVTSIVFLLLIFLVALLIKIPLPVALSLCIPISLILTAMGWLPLVAGAIIIIVLLVIAGFTMAASLNQ